MYTESGLCRSAGSGLEFRVSIGHEYKSEAKWEKVGKSVVINGIKWTAQQSEIFRRKTEEG
jgi:hypothetical protein